MKDQFYTPDQVRMEQKACPLSVGQAEAGRYTYCVADTCMAWQWNAEQVAEAENNVLRVPVREIPEGYKAIAAPIVIDEDGNCEVDVMKMPTHGRCGMVPRNAS